MSQLWTRFRVLVTLPIKESSASYTKAPDPLVALAVHEQL